jgi:hypothetical protein
MAKKAKDGVIVGIVDPIGAGGSMSRGETAWTMRFSFQAWREVDGSIQDRPLQLEMPGLSNKRLNELMERVKPDGVLRVRVRFSAKRDKAVLVEIVGPDRKDKELAAKARELKKPVKVKHPVLGTFTLDRALNWYEAKLPWDSHTVELNLERDGCRDEEALFELAAGFWKKRREWGRRMREFAAAELLELKNDGWLQDDEKPLSARRFMQAMRLEAITLNAKGEVDFTYDDGGLFWGHVIQVSGTLKDGPKRAGIAG